VHVVRGKGHYFLGGFRIPDSFLVGDRITSKNQSGLKNGLLSLSKMRLFEKKLEREGTPWAWLCKRRKQKHGEIKEEGVLKSGKGKAFWGAGLSTQNTC